MLIDTIVCKSPPCITVTKSRSLGHTRLAGRAPVASIVLVVVVGIAGVVAVAVVILVIVAGA